MDTMHLCDAGKEALAVTEWWSTTLCCGLVLCSHHARAFERALVAQGFEPLWTQPLTALTPAVEHPCA